MKLSRLTNEQLATIAATQQPGAGVAEAILVERNRGLIFSTARKHGRSFDIDDAYGIAAYGFIVGVRKFDPSRGYKISTLTVIWMRQSLMRHRENSAFIRTPSYIQEIIPQVKKARDMLGPDASPARIAAALRIPASRAVAALEAMDRQNPLSLDMPLSEDGGTLQDIVGRSDSAEDEVLRGMTELDLSMLTDRQLSAIVGVMEGKEMHEVSGQWGVSRQRAQQWKADALRKLRTQVKP